MLNQVRARKFQISKWLVLVLLIAGPGLQSSFAQNLITESFDGTTFPPTGWTSVTSNATYPWQRVVSFSTTPTIYPSIATHSGLGMACYKSFSASTGSTAELRTPVLNLNAPTGFNQVSFWMYRDNGYPSNYDKVDIYANTTATSTGGTLLGTINRYIGFAPVVSANGWYQYTYTIPASFNTASNYIIFLATSAFGNDMFVDDVSVDHFPPCTGKPTAGTIVPVTPCANVNFNLNLTGNSNTLGGLVFQWQKSLNGNVWNNVVPGNTATITENIPVPTYYRCILTCTNSSQSDTTPVQLIALGTFYYCYCNSLGTYTTFTNNIGNVLVRRQSTGDTLLNNGIATPLQNNANANHLYTDFRNTIAPITLFRDSLYRIYVTEINTNGFYVCTATAFIDYNHSGVFDNPERLFNQITSTTSVPSQQVNDTFRIPDTAYFGITGMRVLLVQTTGVVNPCGQYTYGETEDYLVNINYPPCFGPPNAGTAYISDTTICPGYDLSVGDTTYATHQSNFSRNWQFTTDGGASWNDVPGSANKDTLSNQIIYVATGYRVRMICDNSHDTTYSNIVSVKMNLPYQCYCYSRSNGGATDTSDIGGFVLGNFIIAPPEPHAGGPHIMNPAATQRRTDYTMKPAIILYADSTYHLSIYHTMRSITHGDARVSVFMDFNNDHAYQANSELVFTGLTTVNNWYIDTTIKIPNTVISNVPTGMRLILNNDINETSPANLGCGPYPSGETEDYVVMFQRFAPAGVGSLGNLQNLALYPNPTEGRFTIAFNAIKDISHVDIVVTTIAGQQVLSRSYDHPDRSFTANLDLGSQAKGIYFVQVKADGEKLVRKLIVR